MTSTLPDIAIPAAMLPADGRFGCGPSLVRPEAVAALAEVGSTYLGTSHRQATVKNVVGELRSGLLDLFGAPDGYEILLGNGGSTGFWDLATFGLIESKSEHLVFGEFSSKFAAAVDAAPFLDTPHVISSDPGTVPEPVADDSVDVYAFTHNETSTGASMDLQRPAGDALVAVDATSAAGGLRFDAAAVDCYYFAPQKALGSDGGLWLALCSPSATARMEAIAASDRWIPPSLNLKTAIDNSRKNQTYNTPALATIFLANHQVQWMNSNGGMDFAAGRSDASAAIMYGWAEASEYATPFVSEPHRSHVVATIDIDDAIDATTVSGVLRANGIVDTDSYRKLGRNQLRMAMFPAVDPDDVRALTSCIDHVVEALS